MPSCMSPVTLLNDASAILSFFASRTDEESLFQFFFCPENHNTFEVRQKSTGTGLDASCNGTAVNKLQSVEVKTILFGMMRRSLLYFWRRRVIKVLPPFVLSSSSVSFMMDRGGGILLNLYFHQ